MDLARAEADLNNLIERRARERSNADELEERYRASVGRDRERKRRGLRAEWYCYFSRLAEAHAGISKHFEAKALALLEDDMKGGA